PGVTVETSSPALIERVRSVTTDGTGQYRITDLRPGIYAITFTLAGFGTFKKEGIALSGSFTATEDAELKIGRLEEAMTVNAATPIVDVQNVRQERVLNKDVIDALPSARSPLTLAVLVPGVTSSAQDVGGTKSIGIFNATIHGGRSDDYRVLADGFSIGN